MSRVEDRWKKLDPRTGRRTAPSSEYNTRLRWRAVWNELDGTERKASFATKETAQAFLDEQLVRIGTGNYITRAQQITVAEAAELWKASHPEWAPSTRERNLGILERHVLPKWGATTLGDVRREHVQAWVNSMPGTVGNRKRVHQVLSGILSWAVEAGRLQRNVVLRMRWDTATTSRATKRRQALTVVDADALVAAHPEHWRPWATWLVYTGMRVSEAAGLKAGAIDVRRRTARVEEALTLVNGRKVTRDRGKTRASTGREVPIVDPAWEAVSPLLDGLGPDDYVFRGPRGATVNRANYSRREFRAAAEAIGRPGLEPHELRHTAVSNAIRFGLSVKQVQSIAGHRSASTTLDVYSHLFPEDWEAARERMNKGIEKERRRGEKKVQRESGKARKKTKSR